MTLIINAKAENSPLQLPLVDELGARRTWVCLKCDRVFRAKANREAHFFCNRAPLLPRPALRPPRIPRILVPTEPPSPPSPYQWIVDSCAGESSDHIELQPLRDKAHAEPPVPPEPQPLAEVTALSEGGFVLRLIRRLWKTASLITH